MKNYSNRNKIFILLIAIIYTTFNYRIFNVSFYPYFSISVLPPTFGFRYFNMSHYMVYLISTLYQVGYLLIALSPVGEWVYRIIFDFRSIMTNEEKRRLLPLFNEVKETYMKRYNIKKCKIQLCVDNNILINAYAVGRKTVVITRGAMYGLNDEKIKGIIAHEIGHIHNGDTIIPILLFVGNLYNFISLAASRIIELLINATSYFLGFGTSNKVTKFLIAIIKTIYALLTFIAQCLSMLHRRGNEKDADLFAMDLGYGKALLSALYTLSRLDVTTSTSPIIERMRATHPNIHIRIARIERIAKYNFVTAMSIPPISGNI